MCIASLCHDAGHPGTNNLFHIKTGSDYAMLYNDISVLEMMHVSTSSKILKMEGNNFIEGSKLDYAKFRKLFTTLILNTVKFFIS